MPSNKPQRRTNADILAAWNEPGFAGFSAWLADVRPLILHANNRYAPVVLEPWQESILREALEAGPDGRLLRNLLLLVMPRRHSKSTLWALVILWLVTSRPNFTVACLGNHEQHSQRVQMRTLRRIVRNTPILFKLVGGEANLQRNELRFPATGSLVQMATPTAQSAFGDRLNCLWISDFHACPDLDAANAFMASLLDSEERLTLIDANVDVEGGHVHELELEAAQDPGIYAKHVEYRDFEHYLAEAPAWISRTEARRLQRITLPAAFERDILGKRGGATNALFPAEVIDLCRTNYIAPVPAEALKDLTGGRKYVVGGGLDRSKSLFGGDATVWTVTMKVATPAGEPEYFVLSQEAIIPNTASLLKRAILRSHEAYRLDSVTLENYEAVDLKPWLDDQNIPCELVSAHDTNQNAIFPELHRIAKEGRLHFPADMKDLAVEMQTFVYTQRRDGKYSFGHSSKKFHDDRVYSLAWSIYATRATVLAMFTIGNIQCTSLSPHRRLCFLMGGDLELLCKAQCRAWHEVRGLFQDYRRLRMDDDATSLVEFFAQRVKVEGARVYQSV
ncbi:MAG: hypothetical protein LDL11_06610 [Desulfarculus sp.]|nr:hypothetical protein [Desulfarculus sp.]